MKIFFSRRAKSDWLKLDSSVQEQLRRKIDFFISQKNPIRWADSLMGNYSGKFRFRIGEYRIIFEVEKDMIFVLRVGHRRDIYK